MRILKRVRAVSPLLLLVALPQAAAAVSAAGLPETIGSARVAAVIQPPQTKFSADLPKHVFAAVLSPLFGAAIAGAKTGEEMVKKFSISDPALHLRDAFLQGLAEKYKWNVEMAAETPGEDARDLKKKFSEGFVFDFKTVVWDLTVFVGDHDHYRVEYWGKVRLIRLDDGKILFKETCKFMGRDPKGSRPTLEEMVKDDGTLLKAKLDEAADHCAAELKQRFDPAAK